MCGHASAGTRLDPAALRDNIMRLDLSVLESEQLRALLRLGPRSEELAEISSYLQVGLMRYRLYRLP